VARALLTAGHANCSNSYHASVAQSLLCNPNIAILIAYISHARQHIARQGVHYMQYKFAG